MTDSQSRRLTLFADNVREIKSDFVWQNSMMKHMAAMLYTMEGRHLDNEAIRRSYDLLKASTGAFSMFRGNSALSIAAMLSLVPEQEKRLNDTLGVYKAMKQAGFWTSDFLAVAAYQIAAGTTPDRFPEAVGRMRSFYDGMKAYHPFLTGYDDYIFAAMLGISDVDVGAGITRMEQLYMALKPEFFSGNGVQALTQVLVLGEKTTEVTQRVLALNQAFRDVGFKLEHAEVLSALGVLALLPAAAEDIAAQVSGTFEFLRTQSGFSGWSFPKRELELYASGLTACDYVASLGSGMLTTTLTTSITNILIAQQAAVIAAVAASSTAATAAT